MVAIEKDAACAGEIVRELHERLGREDGIQADLTSRDAAKSAPPEAVALIHAGLGDTEAAFDWLEGAAHAGAFFLTYLNVSPLFDSLRSEPRFGALQRLVRLA